MHVISENLGKRLHAKSIGTLQSYTAANVSLRKRSYCIECHENGIVVRGYFFKRLGIPYENIICMEHIVKREFDQLYLCHEPRYYLKIIYCDPDAAHREESLLFKHPYPLQAVFDHWNDKRHQMSQH